ncbi:MAG: hypothetical protein R8M45_10655 [Ghiorsea sp.]
MKSTITSPSKFSYMIKSELARKANIAIAEKKSELSEAKSGSLEFVLVLLDKLGYDDAISISVIEAISKMKTPYDKNKVQASLKQAGIKEPDVSKVADSIMKAN